MIFKAEIVFVKMLLPLICGIVLGYYFQNEQLLRVLYFVLASLLLLSALINTFYEKLKAWNYKKSIGTLYYLLYFTIGIFISLFHTDFLRSNYFAKKQYNQLKVYVNDEPQQTNDILRFEVVVTNGYLNQKPENCSGNLMIALKLDTLSPTKLKY